MSYWNHRVMRRTVDGETFDAVYEVFYTDDGVVEGWTDNPVSPMSEPGNIREDIERFLRACDKPMLDWETGKEIDNA
jgi:hypothetical protein